VIWQTRNSFLAVLLFAAVALATSSPATAKSTNAAPSCAPVTDAAPAKSASGAATPNAAPRGASVPRKHGAGDANDIDDKDFPPLKPGESFHLIGFSLSGSKHIDEDALIATLPEHQGDPITTAQVKADTDNIKKALIARHVHFAEVTTGFVQRAGPDHCVWVIWDIQHIDAFSQLPYQGYWRFGGQTFSGNKALTNEQLEKAIALKPDERVREGAISDAITGVRQAYDKVFPGQTVKIEGKLKLTLKPARVANFEWQIIEPPAK
jgi:hemolysin activation/secretion protein